jgi:hypothetical protein
VISYLVGAYGWRTGFFAFIPKGEGMLLVPVPALEDLAGLARDATPRGKSASDQRPAATRPL